jgi:hypothetical protein
MTDDRIDWHLWNWERWMRRDRGRGAGYPRQASGGIGRSHRSDFDTMVETADSRCARAVDAIVGGLTPACRGALYNKHGLAVFRGIRDEPGHYDEARRVIGRKLTRKGIV